MQFAPAAAGEQGGGGGDAPDRKRKKKCGGKRHKKAPLPSEPGLEPAAGAESSEDSAGYLRPVAKRRSKFASGGRRASAPLVVACIATLPTTVASVHQVQPTILISACLIAVIGVMLRRSYEAFDAVVEAVETATCSLSLLLERKARRPSQLCSA